MNQLRIVAIKRRRHLAEVEREFKIEKARKEIVLKTRIVNCLLVLLIVRILFFLIALNFVVQGRYGLAAVSTFAVATQSVGKLLNNAIKSLFPYEEHQNDRIRRSSHE